MSSIICHCCGASNSPDPEKSITICKYCKSELSVLEFYKKLSSNSIESLKQAGLSDEEQKLISRLTDDAQTLIQVKDYKTARERFEEILKIHPQHSISRLKTAKCILLDLSINKKERCESVLRYCSIIKSSELEPKIVDLLKSISFDMASLAKYSVNGLETLELFEISKECFQEHKERDQMIYSFLEPKYIEFEKKIKSNISRNPNYSPSVTEINIAISISKFVSEAKGLCLTMHDWITINKKTSHQRALDKVEDLKNASSDFTGKYDSFEKKLFGLKKIFKEI